MTWQRWVQLGLGFALSGFFIWWALRGVNFDALGDALARAHYVYLLPHLAISVSVQMMRNYRFKYLAAPLVKLSPSALFRIGNISMMAVFLLPLRLGEFVRPYLLKREFGLGLSSGLGPVAAERVIDGLIVTLGFFIVTRTGWQVPSELQNAGLGALLLFVSAAVVLGIVLIGHEKGAAFLHKLLSLVSASLADRIVTMVQGFALGLRGLAKPGPALIYIAMSLAVWFLTGVCNWVLLASFDIQQPLMTGMLLVALTVLAVMLPAGPGFVGPFQFAVVKGLTAMGADATAAFAYSLLLHAAGFLVTIGFGMYSLLRAHLSMTNLVQASQAAE